MSDKVNHPPHYGGAGNPREAIKVIEAAGLGWGFAIGSAIKYLLRAGKKGNTLEDLNKAMWFIRRASALFSMMETCPFPVEGEDQQVAPDPDAASVCVITVDPSGDHAVRTGGEAAGFLDSLKLVHAGCPPVWTEGEDGGRLWSGDLTPVRVPLAFCPFGLPLVMLQPMWPAARAHLPQARAAIKPGGEDDDASFRYLKARADVERSRARQHQGEQIDSEQVLFVLDYERRKGRDLVDWIDRCTLEGSGASSDDPAVQEIRLLTDTSWQPRPSMGTGA